MLKSTLQIILNNIRMIMCHMHITQPLSTSFIMNYTNSCHYSAQKMFTSGCWRLDLWSLRIQKLIQFQQCYFINMEEIILELMILCCTFLYSSQLESIWNWIMATQYIPKELGIFLYCFTNCPTVYPVGPVYYRTGHPSNNI